MSEAELPVGWPVCRNLHDAAEQLWALSSVRWPGLSIEVVAEIDSTNSELLRRARAGDTAATVLVARRQLAGRGRLGRHWETQRHAALTCSLSLPLAPVDWSGLSLVVGVVLAERLGHGIGIKWPNDLWWNGRKLCGILIETAAAGTPASSAAPPGRQPVRQVVIGMGINLETPAADGLRTPPVGLAELLQSGGAAAPAADEPQVDLGACALARLVPELLSAIYRFEREGFAPFAQAYATRDVLRGQAISLSDGRSGRCLGLAADGALLVDLGAGVEAVSSGEVSVRPLQS